MILNYNRKKIFATLNSRIQAHMRAKFYIVE